MPARYYRLRIRNAADTLDAFTWTSVPGGVAPHIAEPPRGDGQEIDVLTGRVMFGTYTVMIADADTGGGARTVTSSLADGGAGRYHLLGRKAFIATSADGVSWAERVTGYVDSIRFPDAITAEISIGDSLRIDRTFQIFRETTTAFDRATSIIGGPVRGGWGPVSDAGPRRMKVAVASSGRVRLDATSGSVATSATLPIERKARRYQEQREGEWYYPKLIVRAQAVSGGSVSTLTPYSGDPPFTDGTPAFFSGGRLYVEWPGTLPAVNALYDVYVTPTPISEDNPLHIFAHPIDILTALWTQAGIPWDTTAAAAVKAALGDQQRLLLRPTGPRSLADFQEKEIFGPLGVSFETAGDGEREIFLTRFRDSAAPTVTVGSSDILSDEPILFDLDDKSIIDRVTFRHTRFYAWTQRPADVPSTEPWPERPPDGVLSYVEGSSFESTLATGRGQEIVYELSGTLTALFIGAEPLSARFTRVVGAIASEILSRFATGCPSGELLVKDTVLAKLGRDFNLAIPHQINGNARGGTRVLQVIRRTVMDGPIELKWLDRGVSAQAATVPTFTLAVGATEPKRFFTATLTNAAALAAAGYKVRVEWATGASAPASGTLLANMDPATETILTPPRVDSGAHVFVRMRAEHPDQRPTAFSAWQDLDLADLTAPSGLGNTGNVAEWTPGEGRQEVLYREATDTEDISMGILPAGSDRFDFTGYAPDGTSIVVTVRSRDDAPYAGVSASVTHTFTTGAAMTLTAPSSVTAVRLSDSPPEDAVDWLLAFANPPGTTYHVEQSITSGLVGFTEVGTATDDVSTVVTGTYNSETWYRVRASKPGYATTAYSAPFQLSV